jgi:hypothetical protein
VAFFKWSDVEALVHTFAEIGHAAAIRHTRALALASAVEDLAKYSN